MTERRAIGAGVVALVLLLCLSVGVVLLARPTDTVTEANCQRIADGMTGAEAAAIFGRVPDAERAQGASTSRLWLGNAVAARLVFDANDRVVSIDVLPYEPPACYWRFAALLGF
jgi:hypothetical protein